MAATVLQINEIVSDPKIRGGKPVIKGTRLRVKDVMFTHSTGDCLSPEQITKSYGITLGQVHAALAYVSSSMNKGKPMIRLFTALFR